MSKTHSPNRRHALLWMCAAILLLLAPSVTFAKVSKDLREELMPAVEEGLKSNDPQVKSYAILAAGQFSDKKLDKSLEPFLDNTNREVRQAAIVALLGHGNRKAKGAFTTELNKAGNGRFFVLSNLMTRLPEKVRQKMLKDMIAGRKIDAKLQADALRYIAESESGKTYDLMNLIFKAKGDKKQPFIKALIAAPRTEALPWASKLLGDKKDANARYGGLQMAIAIGGAKVDGMVRTALKDSDKRISMLALEYLDKAGDDSVGPHLVTLLLDTPSEDLKELADRVLASGTKVPLATAQKLLGEDKGDDEALTLSLYALLGASKDKKALEQLKTLERSTLIEERRKGVYGLGYTGQQEAVVILGRTINDGNKDLRIYSAQGLGLLGKPAAITILQKTMQRVREKDVLYPTLKSLAMIKDPNAARVLMFKANDPDPKIKMIALEGLANSGNESVLSVLEVLVNDNDASIRWDATMLMFKLKEASGQARLGRVLANPPEDYVDRVLAMDAPMRNKILMEMLKHKETKPRTDALDALTLMGLEGLPLVRKMNAEGFPKDVREDAVRRLLALSSNKDINLFKRMSQTGVQDDKMRAVDWLHRKSSASTAGFFRTLMNGAKDDPALRMAALYGLLRSQN